MYKRWTIKHIQIFVGKYEGKRQFERPRRRREAIIKM
jgi:hypothetical protein